DPNDAPGEARSIDWAAYDRYRARLADLVPVTRGLGVRKIWAATIDYTPAHPPADPGAGHHPGRLTDRRRRGRVGGWSRDDVGSGRGPRGGGPGAARTDRSHGRQPARPGPV